MIMLSTILLIRRHFVRREILEGAVLLSRKAQFFVELYLEITESEQGQLTCEKAAFWKKGHKPMLSFDTCFIPVSLPLPSKQQNIANIQRAVHLSGF